MFIMNRNITLSLIALLLSFSSFATIGPIGGAFNVCVGNTTTFSDTTAGGTWSSSNTSVATIGLTTGVITGISAGTSMFTYTVGGSFVTHYIAVYALPSAITGASSVCAGSTISLTDTTGGGVWSSSSTTTATVTSVGVVTGVASGATTITYKLTTGCYVTKTVSVSSAASISGSSTVCVGGTVSLTGTPGGGTWTDGATSIATVGSLSGVVTGVSTGVTNIYYSAGGCFAYHTVSVVTGPAAIGGASTVCTGSTITLSDATGGGTWISGSTSVATIGSTGVVTGLTAGTTIITYKLTSGCYVTKAITVSGGGSISGPSAVCVGSTMTLSESSPGGSFFSSSTSIATVGLTSGVVTGVSAGTATIYYSLGGCYSTYTITVTSGATISGSSSVCVGGTITLSSSPGGGTWTDGATSIATVGSLSGVVTGLSTGVTNIYYSAGGCFAYHTVSVVTGPAAIGGASSVCTGSTITLSDATGGGTWISGSTSVATIASTGVVTGLTAGTTIITYKLTSGCYVTKTITVSGGASITGPSTVCVGSTIALSDSLGGGSWISSNTAIAKVGTTGVVTGVSAGTCTIYYVAGGCYAYRTMTVTSGSSITGPSTVCAGSTITLSDGTPGGTWISSNTSLATVSSTGVVTGVSSGLVNIYYSDGGCSAYHTVTVTGGSSISGPSTVCVGSTITLSDAGIAGTWTSGNTGVATVTSVGVVTGVAPGVVNIYYYTGGCYAYHTVTVTGGSHLTGPTTVCVGSTITLSDSSSGGSYFSGSTSVATVGLTSGVVTGVSAGTCTIYYSLGGCYATYTITVTAGATLTGPSSVCVGSTITLSDSPGGGTWSVGASSIATVSSGVVTGVSAGVTNIYYSVGGCYAYHTVTVSGGAISGPSVVCVGSTVTLTDAVGGGSWTCSNTAIATVGKTSGVVTGVAAGTCTIYYFGGGCYSSHTMTVTSASSITGPSTVCAGSTITLSDATLGGTWISSNTSLATVGSTGVVTGISAGVLNIYYSDGGCSAYHTVTVTGGASISGPSTVCVGSTITLTDALGGGSWTSSDTSKAKVGLTSGVVTGVSAGVVNIYYYSGGCYAYHTVTVSGGSSITGPSSVCVGSTITLSDAVPGGSYFSGSTSVATVGLTSGVVTGVSAGTATIYYSAGGCYATYTITVTAGATIYGPSTVCAGSTITLSDATGGGTWVSSNTTLATVSSVGVVTGVSSGVVNIYYAAGGCYAYHTVTVTGGASISGSSTVCIGSTTTLTDATGGGSWSCSNTAVATVGITSGVVTGVSAGTCTIYYVVGGCYAYHTMTVSGTSTITGPSTVCVGSAITLSDASGGGSWISSNTTIGTVTSVGVVTGVSAGVINIYYTGGGCGAYHTVTVTGGASITGPSTVCVGSTITLSDATGGGSWTSNDTSVGKVGLTSGVVTGMSAGTCTIYYFAGGCYAYHTVTVTGASPITGPSVVCVGSTISLSDATPGGTWTSGNTAVATVDASGNVTGITNGTVNIYYLAGGCYTYHTVTVSGTSVISGLSSVCAGNTITLVDATPGGSWTSSDTTIATVNSTGVVTGVSPGVVTIYYSIGGCGSFKVITVDASPVAITGPTTVAAGSTIMLSDATSGGTWISGNTALATVGSTGIVTGLSAGILNIYYVTGGCGVYHTVTVTALVPGGIEGSVVSGDSKGTTAAIPVVGLQISLRDNAGNLITMTSTDNTGAYSFKGLAEGSYVIYPVDNGYTTTPSAVINISATSEMIANIDFKEYTLDKTITPYTITNGITSVTNGCEISVYPNPSSGVLNIKWANQVTGSATVILSDVVGRETYKSIIDINEISGQTRISLKDTKNGVYLLTIKSDNIYYSAKVIVQQ
jgi:type IX secretion system substrate protein/SdrD B-like protein